MVSDGRYLRQVAMEELGEPGQALLAAASVLVAGVGGLGCAASSYLAAAGVGRLILVDRDQVELSNLNRQLLYGPGDLGQPKVRCAESGLAARNPGIALEGYALDVASADFPSLLKGVDVAVDALDSFSARRALNQAVYAAGLPLVHGAACGFEGRLLVTVPGQTPCLGCLLGKAPDLGPGPILGATAGLIGCAQAIEVVKLIVGRGTATAGQLQLFDSLSWQHLSFRLSSRPECPLCGSKERA